jgi:hypothetical protein
MKYAMIDRNKTAAAQGPVEEPAARPDPPAEPCTRKIIMNIAGKRFELTSYVEVREITRGPAKVIEMPIRPPLEP